jgi:hypothetical protein
MPGEEWRLETRSCSPGNILKVIGIWVLISGAVLIAVGETLDACNDDQKAPSSSSYLIDVRPVDARQAKR